MTAPSGQAQNVNVNYANSKIWIRFDFPTDDGGQALSYRLRIDTEGNNINLNEAETDAEAGTEADKTHSGTAYDVVYSFDRWRHPWVFNHDWRSICESGRNFHVKTVSITVSNASGNSGLREVTLSPVVHSGCD